MAITYGDRSRTDRWSPTPTTDTTTPPVDEGVMEINDPVLVDPSRFSNPLYNDGDRQRATSRVTTTTPPEDTGVTDDVTNPSDNVTAPTLTPGSDYVTGDMLISGQLASILDEGSPLFQRATDFGKQQAQASGLLSSSMAAGAAQGALYDTAIDIAKGNAETFTRFGLNQQTGETDIATTGYEGDIQAELNREGYESTETVATMNNETAMELARENNASAETIAAWGNVSAEKIANLNNESAEKITQWNNTAAADRLSDELMSRWNISKLEADTSILNTQADIMARYKITDMQIVGELTKVILQVEANDREALLSVIGPVMSTGINAATTAMNYTNVTQEQIDSIMDSTWANVETMASMMGYQIEEDASGMIRLIGGGNVNLPDTGSDYTPGDYSDNPPGGTEPPPGDTTTPPPGDTTTPPPGDTTTPPPATPPPTTPPPPEQIVSDAGSNVGGEGQVPILNIASPSQDEWQTINYIKSLSSADQFFAAYPQGVSAATKTAIKQGYQDYLTIKSSIDGASWENNGQAPKPTLTFGEWLMSSSQRDLNGKYWPYGTTVTNYEKYFGTDTGQTGGLPSSGGVTL